MRIEVQLLVARPDGATHFAECVYTAVNVPRRHPGTQNQDIDRERFVCIRPEAGEKTCSRQELGD
jgi:hypothetical protein